MIQYLFKGIICQSAGSVVGNVSFNDDYNVTFSKSTSENFLMPLKDTRHPDITAKISLTHRNWPDDSYCSIGALTAVSFTLFCIDISPVRTRADLHHLISTNSSIWKPAVEDLDLIQGAQVDGDTVFTLAIDVRSTLPGHMST